jgi:hypothetical protein
VLYLLSKLVGLLVKEIVMKKALIITTALVLGSSAAMADSFSFNARGSVRVGFGTPRPTVVVRDHRQPAPAPVYTTSNRWVDGYHNVQQDDFRPMPIPANLDCRNWDPALEQDNACNVYSSGFTYQPAATYGAWQYLGTRESAVPDAQFITVRDGRSFGQLKLTAEQGSPIITKVLVRFMDNSEQIINLNTRMRAGTATRLFLDHRQINQIVIYTPAGSHGTYSITAQ